MKTWLEISSHNLRHNLQVFHNRSGRKLMFVVKANAYGHGLAEVLNITGNLPFIEYYAVDSAAEALIVKAAASGKKILVLGWCDDDELRELIKSEVEIVVPSISSLNRVDRLAAELKKKVLIHLKVETGTARLGIEAAEVTAIFNNTALKNIVITGIYSHFANIEDTSDYSFADYQLSVFNKLLKELADKKILKHFSCSASTLIFPKTYFDIVRVGISAYGYWPSKQTFISYLEQNSHNPIELKPVLSWYAKVAQIKTIDKGKFIGYGLTYQTFDRSDIIVIPVGYYDGYDRKLSNISNIIIHGAKAPVRGRICMNMFMADVSHIKNVKEGDRVILLGQQNGEQIDAEFLATLSGSINYEMLARINPDIPRQII